MTTGGRIKALRKAAGYNRVTFADKIGIPHTTLRNYENDMREPGHSFLILISKEFNVTVDYLLGLEERSDSSPDAEMTFGERLCKVRKVKGFTQEQLADIVGVAKSTLTGYERDNREPNMLTIKKLAIALDTASDYLIGNAFVAALDTDIKLDWLDKLNQLKRLSGMTTVDISKASGVPLGTLNKVFAGQTKDPQLSTVKSIVHTLGFTLDDLDKLDTSTKKEPATTEDDGLTPTQREVLDKVANITDSRQLLRILGYLEALAQEDE